jgi:ubiquinone/menaquinone biosynthesis C-methylase UbiE
MRKGQRWRAAMRDFWDRKAHENVMYYISSYRPYDDQDPEEFWKWGRILTERYLVASSIAFTGQEVVLDLGCGIGRFTSALAERFRLVFGVDVSPEMIRRARENLKDCTNVRFKVGNGTDLAGFADETFDFVFSYITFQHIPIVAVTQQYIREIGRVLRDGGYTYFQANNARPTLRSMVGLRSRLRVVGRALRLSFLANLGDGGAGRRGAVGPCELEHAAYRGSRLGLRRLRAACRDGCLEIEDLQGLGSRELWVRARRRPRTH